LDLGKKMSVENRNMSKHLVISRFNEDLGWMNRLPVEEFDMIFIYNKGPDNLTITKNVAHQVIQLPNIGKCDHTYVHHIITNYNNLGDVTLFLPGSCDDPVKWFNTIVTMTMAIKTKDSFFVTHQLDKPVHENFFDFTMNEYETRDERNKLLASKEVLKSPIRPFGYWYISNFPDIYVYNLSYFGIFAVSRSHIHNRSLTSYLYLVTYLSTHHNPEAGHFFERSWLAIFHPVPYHNIYAIPDNQFVGSNNASDQSYTLQQLYKLFRFND